MAKIIKSIHIENFRGIKKLVIEFDSLNIFIGNNGTNKTSIIEAIHYALSPAFLSGRIKTTDFYEGTNEPIKIDVKFDQEFNVNLPDGYTTQNVNCKEIKLKIKKRERKSPGKVLSDLVTIDHIVFPNIEPIIDKDCNYSWEIKRQNGTKFRFGTRLLSFNIIESDEIPRSFYFNKERNKQITKGFNTSFSSILEDFNWRFQNKLSKSPHGELFSKIDEIEKHIANMIDIDNIDIVNEFNNKIELFKLEPIEFRFLDKSSPFEQAFLSKNYDKLNLNIKHMGSGIEMIYALLLLETLASLSKENLIIIIDEPELHLHPQLQKVLAEHLYELSQNSKNQVFITTHSPIFFKTLVGKENVKSMITKKQNSNFTIKKYTNNTSILPWGPTWGEINYFAYDYPTVEFHNELYGFLQDITNKLKCDELDEHLSSKYYIKKNKKWIREKNGEPQNERYVTPMTFIRHKIHHPENKTMKEENFNQDELKSSIEQMIEIIKAIKPHN